MDAYSVQRGGRLLGESLVVLLISVCDAGIGVPLCKYSNQVEPDLICVFAQTSGQTSHIIQNTEKLSNRRFQDAYKPYICRIQKANWVETRSATDILKE